MNDYMVSVRVELYGEVYRDVLRIRAANENAARTEAERILVSRHGRKFILELQVTDIARVA